MWIKTHRNLVCMKDQTLCVFSQIKDRKHIEQNFYSVAREMPRGGTWGCCGESKTLAWGFAMEPHRLRALADICMVVMDPCVGAFLRLLSCSILCMFISRLKLHSLLDEINWLFLSQTIFIVSDLIKPIAFSNVRYMSFIAWLLPCHFLYRILSCP